MNKLLSSFLAASAAAVIFFTLHQKLGVWSFVIAAVSFTMIFWLAQAVIDILSNFLRRKK